MEESKKILVVEDEPNVAILLRHNLKKAGFECDVAENGLIGLEKVKSFKPDLIVSDIMMPELNGFEFRQKLIDDPELGNIPFIFLTAKSADEDMLEGFNLEIDDYLIKTASPKIIIAKINNILKNKSKQKAEAEKEITTAATVLKNTLTPDLIPSFKNYSLSYVSTPFKDVPGGDFLDYYKVDEDNLLVILGDVMGKRWGASYFAVAYAGYIRSAIRSATESVSDYTPATILKKVNEFVFSDDRISEIFISLSIILIRGENEIYYCGAGDLPLLKKSKTAVEEITSNGILLGFNKNYEYKDVKLDINSEEMLIIFTDGVTESSNTQGDLLGLENFKSIVGNLKDLEDPVQSIYSKLLDYTAKRFDDDTSLLCIKKN